MERIKRFFLDEAATAEATSTVVMVAAVGVLLAGALVSYYGLMNGFFDTSSTAMKAAGGRVGSAIDAIK